MHNVKSNAIFLIVPSLSTQLILGNNWLTDSKIIINYNDKIISSAFWNDSPDVIIKSDNIIPRIDTILDNIMCMSLDDEYNHVDNDTSLSYPLEYKGDNGILAINHQNSISGNQITGSMLDTDEQQQLDQLLADYQEIFQDHPGRHNYFSYRFKVIDHKPFRLKPYPVPFARRPAIQRELNRMLDWGGD